MSFPDIVNYLERNPSAMSKVEWDLFTNSKIRASKNIDSYPELILKHSNWPWRFNIKQIQDELSRKISELSKLSKPKTTKPSSSSVSSVKVSNDNWVDKVINSMEKLCEIQNKIKIQESQIIINQIKKEVKEEVKEDKTNIIRQQILSRIINEEMPPDDVRNFSDDEEGTVLPLGRNSITMANDAVMIP
jgi:type III secretory pathway component EscV